MTGATGNLGQSIVKFLKNNGHQLLLVGRDKQQLEKIFGNTIANTSYDGWHMQAKKFDALIHLATRNNNQMGSLEEFRETNIFLLQQIVKDMEQVAIPKLIYFTSLHANEISRTDSYSKTKREAENWLDSQKQIEIVKLRLPAIYTENISGSLRHINYLPQRAQTFALNIAKCLRPVISIDIVFNGLVTALKAFDENREILLSDQQMDNPIYLFIKKIIDFSAGFIVAVFLSWWLMIIIWLIIKLTSKGPGIFAQERVGKDQKVFVCYKFRTMNVGTLQAGTHEVSNSNITGVGKILRKTKLDELPQFVNLLKNDMSLIGPRPCLPNQGELIEERSKRKVFTVKPGISGLAQVKNIDMRNPKELAIMDEFYLDTRTILLDIRLIFATLLKCFERSWKALLACLT